GRGRSLLGGVPLRFPGGRRLGRLLGRHRVVATGVEGVAPRDPADRQPRAAQRPVHLERLQAVRAATRMESALLPEQGTQEAAVGADEKDRSEEHTSELQSRENLVCRLLLEKKKKQT